MKKRRIVAAALAALMVMSLCSCGGGGSSTALSAQGIVQAAMKHVPFSTTLTEQGADYVQTMLGVENCPDAAAAVAAGTVADSIIVACADDSDGANAAKEAMQEYLESVIDEFGKYAPDEVGKLDKAILTVYGNTAVLCVSADAATAKTVLGDIFGGKYDSEASVTSGTTTGAASDVTAPSDATSASAASVTETAATSASQVSPGGYPVIEENGSYERYGAIVRSGDSCYECYYYNKNYAEAYTGYINKFAAAHPDAHVYNMLIPLSSSITLPDTLFSKIPSTDQNSSMEKVFDQLSDAVTPVRLYDTLMQHRKEYVYFRTDHHWTALGAYYGYSCLMQAKGKTVPAIDSYKTDTFSGFLGSFYKDSKNNSALGNHPDEVIVYYPIDWDAIHMVYRNTAGNEVKWNVISNGDSYKQASKYCVFAAGDNPYSRVINNNITDGSCCILVKESFGNALVSFLADSYQTVYEIDYRYYTGSLSSLLRENPGADVVFANNMSMLQSRYLSGKFAEFMK